LGSCMAFLKSQNDGCIGHHLPHIKVKESILQNDPALRAIYPFQRLTMGASEYLQHAYGCSLK
ncbi:MAG: hypothetical protein WAU05_12475, partial [Nitrospira sp.]